MLVAVHALSVVYSLSLKEFATPSLCFHVPIFMAAWCLKSLYSWLLYLLWWYLQLQWDFVAVGCFPFHSAQRLGCWAKGSVQFEESGFFASMWILWTLFELHVSWRIWQVKETAGASGDLQFWGSLCRWGLRPWGMTGEGGASQGERCF